MIAIIDSGGANILSVAAAFGRLDAPVVFTRDADAIRAAERVVLPGVGMARDAMARLNDYGLVDVIRGLTQPVLGICLGMQLLFERSEEGDTPALGILSGTVGAFPARAGLPVPHMGWNNVSCKPDHPLTHGLAADEYFYFVHGYSAPVGADTIGTCTYGHDFTAIAARGNFMGCQFHPERSGAAGQRILRNFIGLPA